MLQNAFSSSNIVLILLSIPAYMFFFSFRGYAQAWTAKRLGDDTPALSGFLTLNPLRHINIIGFICLIFCGIGFGKVIPTQSQNYKHIKRDTAIQILSGPVGGLLFAFIASFLFFLLYYIGSFFDLVYTGGFWPYLDAPWELLQHMLDFSKGSVVYTCFLIMLMKMVWIGIALTVFHLLPLPGFDGYRLIVNFLPYRCARSLYNIEKYNLFIFVGFIALLYFVPGVYSFFLGKPTQILMELFTKPFAMLVSHLM